MSDTGKAGQVAPYRMTLPEWLALESKAFGDEPKPVSERSIEWHKGQILGALCDGKRVPYRVIKAYPEWDAFGACVRVMERRTIVTDEQKKALRALCGLDGDL